MIIIFIRPATIAGSDAVMPHPVQAEINMLYSEQVEPVFPLSFWQIGECPKNVFQAKKFVCPTLKTKVIFQRQTNIFI